MPFPYSDPCEFTHILPQARSPCPCPCQSPWPGPRLCPCQCPRPSFLILTCVSTRVQLAPGSRIAVRPRCHNPRAAIYIATSTGIRIPEFQRGLTGNFQMERKTAPVRKFPPWYASGNARSFRSSRQNLVWNVKPSWEELSELDRRSSLYQEDSNKNYALIHLISQQLTFQNH